MKFDRVIKNGVVVFGGNSFEADVGIVGEEVAAIGKDLKAKSPEMEYDATGCYVAPGFIDSHTHMSLPVSNTVSSDDFFTGGRAGVWGGVTTIIDFTTPGPDQSPAEAIKSRKEEAKVSPIDYSFHGTLYGLDSIEPEDLKKAVDLGVTSFKFFTAYGESNRRTPDGELREAFSTIDRLGGKSMVHCENDEIVRHEREKLRRSGKTSIKNHPKSRPDISESLAVDKITHIAGRAGGNPHLAHLTTGESIDLLEEGKKTVGALTGETCPQYLLLTESSYEGDQGYLYAATPPLRKAEDREALWRGLEEGLIDSVATDHCPFTNDQKEPFKNDFLNIPQGLPGIETLAPLLFTEGVDEDRLSIERVVQLISENPAKIFGLYPEKGSLAIGTDADLVVLDPTKEKVLNADNLHMNSDFNPYAGRTARWWPRFAFLRGKPVLEEDRFLGSESEGVWIRRATQSG
ncbi:MAG: dihydropyrimidinase [Candidatus Bipolaricaulia bacterium]